MSYFNKFIRILVSAILLSSFFATSAKAEDLPELNITVFAAPSQSVWIPALIRHLELDKKHGFKLNVTQKPSNVAYTDFATGKDPFCYCAAIPAVSRFKQQGADIALLWNVFNFESDIVLRDPAIKTLDDLQGKTLLADTISGGWALSKWFFEQQGLDMNKLTVKSSSVRGAAFLAELQLGRVDALLVNPIEGAAAVQQGKGEIHTIPVFNQALWKKISGTDFVPQVTTGVSGDWIAKPENQDLARRFYAANREAAEFIAAHPAEAAKLVAKDAKLDVPSMEQVLRRYRNLIRIEPLAPHRNTIALLTQKLLPEAKLLPRPLTDAELHSLVPDFNFER
ncbi:ABC transporter substrate-binding protein [Brenneria corticis]|nr:ABC transporter substrate-binding protein [Brenneria sp. CFCC 11842]